MSGQPVKTQSDINKYRNEYLETLGLQESINDMNLQANKNYLLSGQLPPQSQMQDTRTNAEKLADVERIKREIADNLRPIAEPSFAYDIVSKVMSSPLNLDNSLLRFLAQRSSSIAEQLKKILPYGIAGDINDLERIVEFIKNMYAEQQGKFQTTKSYMSSVSSQGVNSRVLSGNDIDAIILGLQDIMKNITLISESSGGVLNALTNRIFNMISTLKSVLPSTEEIRLLLQDIENPNFNNPYLEAGAFQIPAFNRADLEAFFKMMEKLPKYSEVMALISKIKQFISSRNFKQVNAGLLNLEKMFVVVDGIQDNPIIQGFRELKQRQQIKMEQAGKLEEKQTRDFIRRQTEEQKDISKAQKVYIVNPADDAVYVRNPNIDENPSVRSSQGPISREIEEDEEDYFGPRNNQTKTIKRPAGEKNALGIILGQLDEFINDYNNGVVDEKDFDMIESLIESAQIYSGQQFLPNDGESLDIDDIIRIIAVIRGYYKTLSSNKKYDDKVIIKTPTKPKTRMRERMEKEKADRELRKLEQEVQDRLDAQGFGLKKKRRGRPRGSGIAKVIPPKIPNFVGFGINEINQKQLKNGIVKIRRNTKTNYADLPSKRVSPNLQKILNTIVGGGVPKYEELGKLDNEEKEYLHKLVSRSSLEDRLSVPAPSKDQQEKDIHNFEVMKGQIMSGNDSQELVKKFKLLIRKLSKQGLLPDRDVDDLIEVLTDLGY